MCEGGTKCECHCHIHIHCHPGSTKVATVEHAKSEERRGAQVSHHVEVSPKIPQSPSTTVTSASAKPAATRTASSKPAAPAPKPAVRPSKPGMPAARHTQPAAPERAVRPPRATQTTRGFTGTDGYHNCALVTCPSCAPPAGIATGGTQASRRVLPSWWPQDVRDPAARFPTKPSAESVVQFMRYMNRGCAPAAAAGEAKADDVDDGSYARDGARDEHAQRHHGHHAGQPSDVGAGHHHHHHHHHHTAGGRTLDQPPARPPRTSAAPTPQRRAPPPPRRTVSRVVPGGFDKPYKRVVGRAVPRAAATRRQPAPAGHWGGGGASRVARPTVRSTFVRPPAPRGVPRSLRNVKSKVKAQLDADRAAARAAARLPPRRRGRPLAWQTGDTPALVQPPMRISTARKSMSAAAADSAPSMNVVSYADTISRMPARRRRRPSPAPDLALVPSDSHDHDRQLLATLRRRRQHLQREALQSPPRARSLSPPTAMSSTVRRRSPSSRRRSLTPPSRVREFSPSEAFRGSIAQIATRRSSAGSLHRSPGRSTTDSHRRSPQDDALHRSAHDDSHRRSTRDSPHHSHRRSPQDHTHRRSTRDSPHDSHHRSAHDDSHRRSTRDSPHHSHRRSPPASKPRPRDDRGTYHRRTTRRSSYARSLLSEPRTCSTCAPSCSCCNTTGTGSCSCTCSCSDSSLSRYDLREPITRPLPWRSPSRSSTPPPSDRHLRSSYALDSTPTRPWTRTSSSSRRQVRVDMSAALPSRHTAAYRYPYTDNWMDDGTDITSADGTDYGTHTDPGFLRSYYLPRTTPGGTSYRRLSTSSMEGSVDDLYV